MTVSYFPSSDFTSGFSCAKILRNSWENVNILNCLLDSIGTFHGIFCSQYLLIDIFLSEEYIEANLQLFL